jgi:predicted RNase H-like HicB family nuclease
MTQCAVVIEKGEENFSDYVPDLPGFVSTGATLWESIPNIRETIAPHIESPSKH